MKVRLVVEVEVEHVTGKFAGRDEIEETLIEWLDGANEERVDGVGADGDSEYEVVDWAVAVPQGSTK